jgi:MOSC domain-containing protein YiiM
VRIVSVNVGLPRPVSWRGRTVETAIFKAPVEGSVGVRRLNLDGDRQADLTVHGGTHKAVYAYPSEHYPFWERELGLADLDWGAFGENLTTLGFLEDEVCAGDRFRAGSAELVVTQPRLPCGKLGVRFGRDDVIERFLQSGRPGFYLAVVAEGEVAAGEPFERIHRDENGVTVNDLVALYLSRREAPSELLRRAARVEALPESWRAAFRAQLGA